LYGTLNASFCNHHLSSFKGELKQELITALKAVSKFFFVICQTSNTDKMEVIIIGDLVQLKSGGPRMTVKRIIGQGLDTWQGKTNEQVLKIQGYKDGDMVCIWFEENKLNEGVFPLEALQKV
jgi:uncharacterized protein YodC (DUF2158 family)